MDIRRKHSKGQTFFFFQIKHFYVDMVLETEQIRIDVFLICLFTLDVIKI